MAILSMIYCSAIVAVGQLPRPFSTPISEPKPIIYKCYSASEINLTTTNLGANYTGNDLRSIATEIHTRENLAKDEFETTVQFRERVAKAFVTPLDGNLLTTSYYAFLFEASLVYDADSQKMNIELDLSKAGLYPDFSWYYPGLVPCSERKKAWRDGKPLNFIAPKSIANTRSVWRESFPVNLDVARELKPRLRALLIVKLASENGRYASNNGSDNGLYVDLKQIWVVDQSVGNVLRKFEINDAKFDRPKTETSILVERAGSLIDAGKEEEAMVIIRRLLVMEPMNAYAYFLRAKIHIRNGDFDNAINNLNTSIFWDHRLIEAQVALARIYVDRKDCLKAKTYITAALEIDSSDADTIAVKRLVERCT